MLPLIGSGWTLAGKFICKKKAPKLKFDLLIKTDIYFFYPTVNCQLPSIHTKRLIYTEKLYSAIDAPLFEGNRRCLYSGYDVRRQMASKELLRLAKSNTEIQKRIRNY